MTGGDSVSRRGFLRATGGAAAATLAGCSSGGTNDDGGSQDAVEGGTLDLINVSMSTFDPIGVTDEASNWVASQVFDGLVTLPDGKTSVAKALARGYQTNDDYTRYVFTLQKGATFHDGREVTAHDFVYAWNRLANSLNSNRGYFLTDTLGVVHETRTVQTEDGERTVYDLTGVQATDEYTLEIELERAFASTLPILAFVAFVAVPEGIVGDIEGYEGEMSQSAFATNPVGAGPFELDHWKQGEEAVATRYEDYHGQTAYVDAVRWHVIPSPQAAYTFAMNGNADAFKIPTPRYSQSKVTVEEELDNGRKRGTYGPVQNGEAVNFASVPEVATFFFAFDTNNVPKPVRQAVAYVTNQQQIVEQVFKGRHETGYHLTPPAVYPGGPDAYHRHAEEQYPYGYNETLLEEATQVMEDAGYSSDEQFDLTFTHYPSATWRQIGQILRDRLGGAHINLQIEQLGFSQFIQQGASGNLDAYTYGWIADWPAPDTFLQLIYPPRTDTSEYGAGASSFTNWSGTAAARRAKQAYERVQENFQPTEEAQRIRNEAYVTMEEANWEDAVLVQTMHSVNQTMWYDHLHMPVHGPMGMARMKLNDAWLEESAHD